MALPMLNASLPWRIAASAVWIVVVLAAAGAYAYQTYRTDVAGNRVSAINRLERKAAPVWDHVNDTLSTQYPPAAMPLPVGDPLPTLRRMMAFPGVNRAFHVSADHRLTVVGSLHKFEQNHYSVDLRTWRPETLAAFALPGKPAKARYIQHFRELYIVSLLESGHLSLKGKSRSFDDPRQLGRSGREDAYINIRRIKGQGLLGYSCQGPSLDYAASHKLLERYGLSEYVEWSVYPSERESRLTPGGSVPILPEDLTLVPKPYGLNVASAESDLEAAFMLPLFGMLAYIRLKALVGDGRQLLNERAIALAQSNFVSGVSHEMRTPLTTIKLYAEMLEAGLVDAPEKRELYLRTIVQESDRLTRLIENVLDYAQISGRRKDYTLEPVDLRDLVTEAVAAVAGPLERAGMAVECHAPVPLPATVDRDALVQSLINLLSNSIKYAPGGKRIVITAMLEGPEAVITVQDFGPGIPHAERRKIFKPFYRVGSELTRSTSGAGLGLALVAETLKAHQGRVVLDTEPGSGARFSLRLPIRKVNLTQA